MSAISFSSTFFTDEDVKRELNKLTDEEKQIIVNDKYGRQPSNNSNNINANETDPRDEELLAQMFAEIDKLPPHETGNFWQAFLHPHDGMESECNPWFFVLADNYDTKKAAKRICKYWDTRVEVFGDDKAFQPLTLRYAMEDVVPYMVQIPNICRILPDDDHGRTVVCWDRSNMSFKDYEDIVLVKIAWFVLHAAMRKESSRENGVIIIIINRYSTWDFPTPRFTKLLGKSFSDCLPIKICCVHRCISSLVASLLYPFQLFYAPPELRVRKEVHNSVKNAVVLKSMEPFGLRPENLPKSIGGSYDEKPTWIDECEGILKRLQKKKKQEKRRRQNINTV